MIPLPTVFATAVVTNAPARFATAETSTAERGESARVADPGRHVVRGVVEAVREVERERDCDHEDEQRCPHELRVYRFFTTIASSTSAAYLAGVHGLLEALVDVLPADHLERVDARHEEARDAVVQDPVAHVLELAQLGQMRPRVLEALEQRDRVRELPRRAPDDLRLLPCLQADLADAVGDDPSRRLVDVVADVVERPCEPVHVVAVERRHERAVEEVDELVRQPVALVLELLHVAREVVRARPESGRAARRDARRSRRCSPPPGCRARRTHASAESASDVPWQRLCITARNRKRRSGPCGSFWASDRAATVVGDGA